jgi:acyl transferase domain-containing protein/thioesterase domain-containing protein/SAM-dependent methyltransferase
MDDEGAGADERPEAIAIIGMAGRFPGADGPEALWARLCAGDECLTQLTDEELDAAGVPRETYRDPRYVRARGRLREAEVQGFDHAFFGMSLREAELTDPQHRLFLECAWEALERAGHDPRHHRGPIGVFGGAASPGYLVHHVHARTPLGDIVSELPALLGNDKDHLCTRTSYKLDLRGPSLTVQSACSTGLVAVHAACQSLLGYQCDLALAGAVSLTFPLDAGYLHQPGNIASPDGHCRAFDARAEGAVGGDGVAVVALKRLSEALADGDHIHAVILGVAINNDGAAKVGYTAPSLDGQAEVIAMAHALAQVNAGSIGYVEAHGTGTALGDPIEIAALTRAFRSSTRAEGSCAVGSLKTNLGHLNTAAGIAGLIKATLAVEHGLIPASLHFETPSPAIDFTRSPFYVSRTLHPFPEGAGPRRAGVSAFGIGGTNAHAVLEQAPAVAPRAWARPRLIFPLSARSPEALEAASQRLAEALLQHPERDLADVAHTLQIGRRAFAQRRFICASTREEALAALRTPGPSTSAGRAPEQASVVFLFPGQGAQHAAMAAELHRDEPVFREHFDRCAALLAPTLGVDLRALLGTEQLARDPALVQPALFSVEYALARLWMHWGITPAAMLGHSLGEYVAACLAGVFSLEDVLALVAARGKLMASLPAGAMLAVPCGEQEARALCSAGLSLAAVNGPQAAVLSGPLAAIEALERRLIAEGRSGTRLRASHAFHSAMMDPILDDFRAALRRVRFHAPRIPYLGNLRGTWVSEAEATDPEHWIGHLRGTVRFADGLAELASLERGVLLEVGPGRSLGALALQRAKETATPVISSLPSASSAGGEGEALIEAVGRLWIAGAPIDWRARDEGDRRRVPLPTYPFERQRCWIDRPHAIDHRGPALPDLGEAEQRIRATLAIRPIESYPGLEQALDGYCAQQVLASLKGQGVDTRAGQRHARGELARRLGILPSLARLFDALLLILAEDGLVRLDDEALTFTEAGARGADLPALRRDLDARYPELRGIYDLVDHCVAHYPEALAGKVPAIGVLYPGGSARLVEESAQHTVEHRSERVYITLLVEAVTRLAAASPARLRILEIGGGRGTLTWPLLEALQGRADYHFTDLGKVFLDDAAEEAARRGLAASLTFGPLDISMDPRAQGLDAGSFDLVVGFNVVHAARDVPAALQNLAALLAPGGVIGLVEVVKTRRWDTLTWGLAEGWWHHADALRERSPLLDLDTWQRALGEAGFAGAAAYPRGADERARQDHGLILARRGESTTAPIAPRAAPRVTTSPRARAAGGAAYVAPRSEIERKVAAVCEEIVGAARIGVLDDLYELGADSLVTLRIMDRLRRDPTLQVPAGAAFRGATVEKIAAAIGGGDRAPGGSSPLVPLQPGGTRPPLFFVHPAAGVVFPYVELARTLGIEQPFYGLQALGLDGLSAPDQRIEDMAARYVAALRTVQPEGPYYLGGFSFGCLVAFEMAQQLAAAGETIALLALVDEPAPVFGHRPSSLVMGKLLATGIARSIWPYLHDYFYLRSGKGSEEEAPGEHAGPSWMSRLSDGSLFEQFLAQSTMANFVPRDARVVALRQPAMVPMFELFLLHLRETMRYVPRAYAQRVTLFRATRLGGRFGKDATMGWGLLAAGGVEVHELQGEHLTLLRQPHVNALAAALERSLEEARSRVSRGGARRG